MTKIPMMTTHITTNFEPKVANECQIYTQNKVLTFYQVDKKVLVSSRGLKRLNVIILVVVVVVVKRVYSEMPLGVTLVRQDHEVNNNLTTKVE